MQMDTLVARATAPFSAASVQIDRAVRGIAGFVRFEVVMTAICATIPLILIAVVGWPPLASISDYYDMTKAQYFYMPLTAAAMLFMVNGVVKHRHWYNVALGLSLAGLTFFNTDDFSTIHTISAVAFFAGNAVVFVVFSPKKELWFKTLLVALMAVAIVAWFPLGWISLFWAESLSLWLIAVHFALEALGVIE